MTFLLYPFCYSAVFSLFDCQSGLATFIYTNLNVIKERISTVNNELMNCSDPYTMFSITVWKRTE